MKRLWNVDELHRNVDELYRDVDESCRNVDESYRNVDEYDENESNYYDHERNAFVVKNEVLLKILEKKLRMKSVRPISRKFEIFRLVFNAKSI